MGGGTVSRARPPPNLGTPVLPLPSVWRYTRFGMRLVNIHGYIFFLSPKRQGCFILADNVGSPVCNQRSDNAGLLFFPYHFYSDISEAG